VLESYRCPFCQKIVEIDLTRELDRGQTDLRERIDQRQNLKIDLPRRLFVTCTGCSRQFIVQPEGIV
jgi:DNA-directed RNA polymerase subunit RPC12/RpoP